MASKTKKKKEKVNNTESNNDKNIGMFIFGHKFDAGLLIIVLILLAVGLIMMMSASAPYSYRTEDGDSYYYFIRQMGFAGVGIILMFIVSHIDYRILNSRISWLVYIVGLRLYEFSISARNRCKEK